MDNCGKLHSQKDGTVAHAEVGCEIRGPRPAGAMAGVRACSACAGDYEDPDGKAWGPDESGGDECEDETDHLADEFPAEEQ